MAIRAPDGANKLTNCCLIDFDYDGNELEATFGKDFEV